MNYDFEVLRKWNFPGKKKRKENGEEKKYLVFIYCQKTPSIPENEMIQIEFFQQEVKKG